MEVKRVSKVELRLAARPFHLKGAIRSAWVSNPATPFDGPDVQRGSLRLLQRISHGEV